MERCVTGVAPAAAAAAAAATAHNQQFTPEVFAFASPPPTTIGGRLAQHSSPPLPRRLSPGPGPAAQRLRGPVRHSIIPLTTPSPRSLPPTPLRPLPRTPLPPPLSGLLTTLTFLHTPPAPFEDPFTIKVGCDHQIATGTVGKQRRRSIAVEHISNI